MRHASRFQIHPDNPKVMGLHIRRTDRIESREISTDDAFRAVIDAELECDPEVRFFLASDCIDTQTRFIEQYGDRLMVREKPFDGTHPARPTPLADAVVELFLLARTHYIYGSYASSFSKVASIMRGTKFHQLGFV